MGDGRESMELTDLIDFSVFNLETIKFNKALLSSLIIGSV